MKKLMLTTVAFAALSGAASASTQPGQVYFKVGGGYNMGKNDTASSVTYGTNPNTMTYGGITPSSHRNLKGFSGAVGVGYNFMDNLAVEGVFDYKQTKKKNKIADSTSGVAINLGLYNVDSSGASAFTVDTPGAVSGGLTPSDANPVGKVALSNATSEFREKAFGLGVKLVGRQPINDQFNLVGGIGVGYRKSDMEIRSKGTLTSVYDPDGNTTSGNAVSASSTLDFKHKSKSLHRPVGLVSLGAEYNAGEGIFVGIEYDAKFTNKKDYKAKTDINGKQGPLALAATPITSVATAAIAKGAALPVKGNTIEHAIMLSVRFGL